jgi:hypothetical protein
MDALYEQNMKEDNEFLKKMENLKVPDVDPAAHADKVKMAILNAERSAALGVWLIVVPCYFLFCVFMYYFSHIHLGWFTAMFKLMQGLEKTSYVSFMGPIILVVLPIVCIVINFLSIVHVSVHLPYPEQPNVRAKKVAIMAKPVNILLILLSLAIVFVFLAYVMAENISVGG